MSGKDESRIVVFGSIVQDLISYTKKFPRAGESVRGVSFQSGAGGKGANQAVAAARLGATIAMIGMVGEDMFGDSNIASLKANGVEMTRVAKSANTHTATATITVNGEGENSIVVTLGANLEMSTEIADRHSELISSSALVMCQGEIPEAGNRHVFEIARQNGVSTFLNPAPGDANMDKSILQLVDIVCTNENEAEFITNIAQKNLEDAKLAAKEMLKMGPKYAIITMGAKGVLLASKEGNEQVTHIQVDKVHAVDTTGAGDCFCGSLAALIVRKIPIEQAIRCAANLAALSVTRKGTQSSYWKEQEIREKFPNLLPF